MWCGCIRMYFIGCFEIWVRELVTVGAVSLCAGILRVTCRHLITKSLGNKGNPSQDSNPGLPHTGPFVAVAVLQQVPLDLNKLVNRTLTLILATDPLTIRRELDASTWFVGCLCKNYLVAISDLSYFALVEKPPIMEIISYRIFYCKMAPLAFAQFVVF